MVITVYTTFLPITTGQIVHLENADILLSSMYKYNLIRKSLLRAHCMSLYYCVLFFVLLCLPHASKVLFLDDFGLSVIFLFVHQISLVPLNGFAPNSQRRRVWSFAWTSLNVKVKG